MTLKSVLVLLCIVHLTWSSLAQSAPDSLFQLWEDTTHIDSVRASALHEYIYEGPFYHDPRRALELEEELIAFARQKELKEELIYAIILQGYTHFVLGDYAEALDSYREGLTLAEASRDTLAMADLLMRTGFIYHDNDNLVIALDYYERSRNLYSILQDTSGLAAISNEFGSIFRAREEYDKALDYYEQALAFHQQMNDGDSSSAMLQNMGILYLNKKDYAQALKYTEQALEINSKRADPIAIAIGLAQVGEILLLTGETSQGLDSLEKSLQLNLDIGNAEGAMNSLIFLGNYYLEENQFQRSENYAERALDLARSVGDFGGQKAASHILYTIHKSIGNTERALEYHEEMFGFTDSIQAEAASVKLQRIEFDRQVMSDSLAQVKREMQMQMAFDREVRKKDLNRKIATGVGVFFLVLAASFYSRWRYVKKSRAIIEQERDRSDSLLLNILPREIAEELKNSGQAAARDFEKVSILFTDFKGFTEKSAQLSATELLNEINHCFQAFDHICEEYQIEKIKTIGDAYMAAGGLPVPAGDSARRTVLAALAMQAFILERYQQRNLYNEVGFEMRVGIHTGPVVAGIVGVKKFQYDVWGDTVNTAARVEGAGAVGTVNISRDTYELLADDPAFTFTPRGSIDVKGKGAVEMWFVDLVTNKSLP